MSSSTEWKTTTEETNSGFRLVYLWKVGYAHLYARKQKTLYKSMLVIAPTQEMAAAKFELWAKLNKIVLTPGAYYPETGYRINRAFRSKKVIE